jgi:hypothetical protein
MHFSIPKGIHMARSMHLVIPLCAMVLVLSQVAMYNIRHTFSSCKPVGYNHILFTFRSPVGKSLVFVWQVMKPRENISVNSAWNFRFLWRERHNNLVQGFWWNPEETKSLTSQTYFMEWWRSSTFVLSILEIDSGL